MTRVLAALLAVLALAACAPLRQGPGTPDLTFQGPRFERDAFVSFDGARLGLRRWETKDEPWAVIVGLHGMNDHSMTFHLAADRWAGRGIATYAYDMRGFGRSPRRGVWPEREIIAEDLRTAVSLARQRHPRAIIAVAGISMGGAAAIDAFASERPPAADRLVLLAPAVWGWSSQALPNRVALWFMAHTFRGLVIEPPEFITEDITATDNLEELRRMGADELMLWGARPDALYGLMNLMQRGWRGTGRVRVPTLYAYGARDDIIPKQPSVEAAGRLASPPHRTAYYLEGYHLLLSDLQRDRVADDVAAFLREPAAPLPSGAPPIPATKAEAERLAEAAGGR